MRKRSAVLAMAALALVVSSCGGKTHCMPGAVKRDGECVALADGNADADADIDADADSDADSDSDSDGDRCDGEGGDCYEGPAGTAGIGVCTEGMLDCTAGRLECVRWVGPSPEVCNARDDDCDGQTDEAPCPGLPCEAVAHGTSTYLFCTEARTWEQAREVCIEVGGDLVTIGDAAEDAWVMETAGSYDGGSWWMGLNDIEVEGSFVWADGSPVAYTNWNPGEPNDLDGEDCGETRAHGENETWNDLPCSWEKPAVCEIADSHEPCDGEGRECYEGHRGTAGIGVCSMGTLVCHAGRLQCDGWVGPTAEDCNGLDDDCDGQTDEDCRGECPDGYVQQRIDDQPDDRSLCYRLDDAALSWLDAREICQADGGELASVQSAGESEFLFDWCMTVPGTNCWIGGNDIAVEAEWVWSDGTPWTYLDIWSHGPDNFMGNQDCLMIWQNGVGTSPADDEFCDLTHPFFCKRAP